MPSIHRFSLYRIILLLTVMLCGGIACADDAGKNGLLAGINNASVLHDSFLRSQGCCEGVAGAFGGQIDGSFVIAGGCNFPEVPAAEGGTKRFYDEIYAKNAGQWSVVGHLPTPIAYGVSASVDGGIICAGGTADGKRSSRAVWLIKRHEGRYKITPLAELPFGIDNAGAATDGKKVYLAGGQTDGVPNLKVLSYDIERNEWCVCTELGEARVQPAVAIQNGATGTKLYVMGGFDPTHKITQSDGIAIDLKAMTCRRTSEIRPYVPGSMAGEAEALVGSSAIACGCAHIIFVGGVNKSIFEKAINYPAPDYMLHPADWYKFRRQILVYHTITDTWMLLDGNYPGLARAGAAVIKDKDGAIIVGGELKPGIRSDKVSVLRIKTTPHFGWLNWVVLILYLLGMLALGYYFMKHEKGADEFFKGGGRIPWWAAGISIYATMLSAITYMAYPAKAYATDWTYYPMLVTILLVSFPVVKYYLPFFRKLNVTTAYEYLERRFNVATRMMASALFIIFMVARMALVLYLPSLALTAVTGIDIYICIVLMAAVTIVYCTMGGVEAVVWGDVVQGFILVGGAIFAFAYLAFGTEGGFGEFARIASADEKFRLFDWSLDYRSGTFWVIILGGMANNLISYTSDQTVIQRYLTTKDESEARRSILMNGVMSVAVSIVFFAIGAGLYTFFKTHPQALDITMSKGDIIFPYFMMSQLPAGLAGLLIAAIFAATMSTISSNINSVATAFSVDFYKRWRPNSTDSGILRCARTTCVVSGLIGMAIALLMATWSILSLLDYFQEILGLLSSGLGGLFFMGIFFPRIGGKAALVGFISGVTAVFITKYATDASFLLYGFIGMAVSVCAALLTSYIINERRAEDGLSWQTLKRTNHK